MNLLSKVKTKVTEVVYFLQDDVSAFVYKEWKNEEGKIIDAMLQDKDGYQLDSPILLEMVEEYLDSIGEF